MSTFFPEVWQDLHEVTDSKGYNPNVISWDTMFNEAVARGRKEELYEVLMLLKAIPRPGKQVQDTITELMSRWDSYNEETS